jgi:hypothetical protein
MRVEIPQDQREIFHLLEVVERGLLEQALLLHRLPVGTVEAELLVQFQEHPRRMLVEVEVPQ